MRSIWHTTSLFVALTAVLCLEPGGFRGAEPDADQLDALWVASRGDLLKLALADGSLLQRLPLARGARAVAIDEDTARAWLFDDSDLLQVFDFGGEPLASTAFTEAGSKVRLAAGAGFAWLGFQRVVYQVDEAGAVVTTLTLAKNLRDLAFEPRSGTLWVLGARTLEAYDLVGQPVATIDLGHQANAVALDAESDAETGESTLWVGVRSGLRRYAGDGALLFEVPLHKVVDVAADGTGGCWVGLHDEVVRLGGGGEVWARAVLPHGGGAVSLVAVAADPAVPAVWAASKDFLFQLDGNGRLLRQLSVGELDPGAKARDLAAYADRAPPTIAFLAPVDGTVVERADPLLELAWSDAGIGVDPASLEVRAEGSGVPVSCTETAEGARCAPEVALPAGSVLLTATVADFLGNRSEAAEVTVEIVLGPRLPPNPATVAPPLDRTVAHDLFAASEFLWQGEEPIQAGVAPGALDPRRLAVLRGRVLDRGGLPLPGVGISLPGHPELGTTLSRADGAFDLAVNGGGELTIRFQLEGFVPVDRRLTAAWRDVLTVDDVAMTPLSEVVTTITAGAAVLQVARGETSLDADGERRSTFFFQPHTRASMVLPDGSTEELTTFSVRSTELTVGADGPAAMPAPLPPTTGYTYAFEASVDEAIAAGAVRVDFDPPVAHYVENFLGFPVGGVVPTGYYDRRLGAWVASENGRVVELLGVDAGGMALVDVDGSGEPAEGEALLELGITDEELRELASLYAPGQSLWRASLSHFTPWDCNWPYGPPGDARAPSLPFLDPPDVDLPDCAQGSIIECQNRGLREDVALVGTPFRLHYSSSRVPQRQAARTLRIELSGEEVPASLKRIELEIEVAGREYRQSFSNAPSQSTTFVWDGLDAYGREVQGTVRATARVGYVYDAVYFAPEQDLEAAFARFPEATGEILGPARSEVTLWSELRKTLSRFDARGLGVGGWSLTPHHALEPFALGVLLGGGGRIDGSAVGGEIARFAGDGVRRYAGDGGPAVAASLDGPTGLDVGADGSLYVVDRANHVVRRIDPQGRISTVAGTGERGQPIDGAPAVLSPFETLSDVAVASDGALYLCELGRRLWRVTPGGTLQLAASLGSFETCQDVTVGPDGSIYWSTIGRIWRLDPVRGLQAWAGRGQTGFSPDGTPAAEARLAGPVGLEAGPDGSLYFFDNARLRRIGPGGLLGTVAGSGAIGCSEAIAAPSQLAFRRPVDLDVAPDGTIYVADRDCGVVHEIHPGRFSWIVAGSGRFGSAGDGGAATEASFRSLEEVAFGPDRSLYLSDGVHSTLRRVALPAPRAAGDRLFWPSRDGQEVYVFDSRGRHLETRDALTGAVAYRFSYQEGLLAAIDDVDSLRTTIERDTAGRPTAIVAPFGQRTELEVDAEGWLRTIRDPAGEEVRPTHTAGGLLISMRDPRGGEHRYLYTPEGHLERDLDPGGGFQELERTGEDDDYEVTLRDALGEERRYAVEQLPDGGERRRNTGEDGLLTETILPPGGRRQASLPDGTEVELVLGPDPRFGLLAAIPAERVVHTPAGLERRETLVRSAALAADGQTLVSLDDERTVNGKTTTRRFEAASGEIVVTSPAGRSWRATLDADGRLVEGRLGDLESVHVGYDAEGRPQTLRQGSGADERLYTLGYDEAGRIETITDPTGRTSSFGYDDADRVVLERQPSGRETTFGYDASGNPTAVTPPGRPPHLFTYTPLDLLAGYTPPGATSSETVSYDLDRRPLDVVDLGGRLIALEYDAAGRIDEVVHPRGTIDLVYDAASGRLTAVTTLESSLAFDYDGFLMTETSWSGEVAGSVAWVYDGDFRLASEQVGGGPAVAFQYDADDLPVAVGELTIARDPATGFIAGTALGAVTTERTYTAFGELESLEARLGGAVLYRLELERDAAGRIVAEVETLGPESHARAFGYDLDGRLETVERDGLPWATYAYDPNGNRLSAQGILGDVTADYDEQDRLLCHGDTTYAYLPSGELSSKSQGGQAVHFDYDVFGALQGVTLTDGRELAYVVDPAGRRVGKKVEGQLVQGFLYTDALKPIAELDGAGNLVARFVYGTSPLVPDYLLKGGRTYRILADARSSPRLVVDVESGEIAQRLDYGPFGRVLFDSNPGFQPFGFAGGLYDPQTGLLRFGARDYDPEVGRWTAKDPILFAGGDSNLYAYVLNDPVNLVDPTGEIVPLIVAGGTIGALIGGGIYSVSTWVRGDDFDWKSLAAASAAGAIAGGLGVVATPIAGAAGLGTGVAGTALVNAGIGIVSAAVGAGIDPCQDVTIKYLSSSAAFGVTGGAVGSRIFPPRGMSRFGQVGFPRTWPGVVPRSLGGNAGTNARRAIYRGGTTSVFIGAVGPTYVQ